MDMTNNLTQPLSKKLLLSLLIIAFGAEIDLYFTRFSSLASTLYDGIMVASIFIGWRISPRLHHAHAKQKTKRQLTLLFTGAFLIFYFGSTVINVYSSFTFQDFSNNYDQYVKDYTNPSHTFTGTEPANDRHSSFFEKLDTLGYDIYTDSLAGLEEVWRLSYMILVLMVLKKIFRIRWEKGSRDIFLMLALFLTSVIFGIDHTLDTEQTWSVKLGSIVTFANMGFLFGILLLWTRHLWIMVFVHALYDIMATLSWYYFDYALEAMALLALILHVTFLIMEKRKTTYAPVEEVHFTE
jgi:hypothetical protein